MGNIKFGKAMRFYRKQHGWSQQELADELGVDRLTVSRWENGVVPRYSNVQAMADIFGVNTSVLLEGQPCTWIDAVIAKLGNELTIVETNLKSEDLPDDLRAYAIGKKEALNTALKLIEIEREVANE